VDPLSSPVVEALRLRPAQGTGTLLSSLLRDGRVVAGEVLEVFEGTAFLSLGGSRVAAETDVELEPGQRFFARVEQSESAVVLRLIGKGTDEELPLVTALRAALADHAAPGALLTRLAADLRAVLATQREPAEAPATRDGAHESPPDRSTLPAAKLLARIEAHVEAPLHDGPALATALARSGSFHEALLLRGKVEHQLAREDLKSVLMEALEEMKPGAASDGVRRALGGIEADQLLDVARSQTGDARQIGFALPDGARFADARLVVDPEGHAREQSSDGTRKPVASVDLSVDFSSLGPVKAELRLDGGTLRVRFLVASPEVAERLAADQEQLCADLGRDLDATSARSALLSVAVVDARSIEQSALPSDVRFLGEHLLVDRTA
jgi:hypothetical protein